MIKCGIIGYGKMGRIRAKAIEESGRGNVVCAYDSHEMPDCPYEKVPTDSDVINHPEVDAVFVCTPNYRIEPLVIQALEAGKHVFSEKPPAFDAVGVERIRAAEAAAAGCKLMYGFNHRHHGSIQRMKEIIDSGQMGKVLWMRGRYGKEVDERFFEGWRAKKDLAGGGIMLDQGIHMLDLFLFLGGGFDEVHAFVSNLFWHIEGVEDNCFAIFRNSETGICASLHSTMTQWRYLFSLEVFLEGGALILNGLKTSSGAYGDEDLAIKRNTQHVEQGKFDSEERIVFHTDTSWASEISQFFDCIEKDQPVGLGSSQDALKLMKLIDRIYGKE
jgi:1,5-anhydro-D-fructose reductase (1,5-anhydro-D-mannitol-forming)